MKLPKFVRVSSKVARNCILPAIQSIAGKKVKVVGRVDTPIGPAYKVETRVYGVTQVLVGFCDPCGSSGRAVPII